jgi:hypothetical protein
MPGAKCQLRMKLETLGELALQKSLFKKKEDGVKNRHKLRSLKQPSLQRLRSLNLLQ